MRPVRCAVNFNDILQIEGGLEEMWAESRDTVNEKFIFAIPKPIRMWLNGDGADLQKLGIIPTQQQLHNNRPGHTQRCRCSSLPWEPPNQDMTAGLWVSTMLGRSPEEKRSLTGRKQQTIRL